MYSTPIAGVGAAVYVTRFASVAAAVRSRTQLVHWVACRKEANQTQILWLLAVETGPVGRLG